MNRGGSKYRYARFDCRPTNTDMLYMDLSPSDGSPLAASRNYLCVSIGDKGDIQLLPTIHADYNRKDKPTIIHAHTDKIHGLEFNPFNYQQLISASADSSIKLWDCKNLENITNIGTNAPVFDIATHKSTSIVAASTKNSIEIFDLNVSKVLYNTNINGYGKDILSIDWTYKGDRLLGIGKNSACYNIDPREKMDLNNATIIKDFRAQKIVSIGKNGYFLVLGANKMRKPQYLLYDSRNFDANKPLWTKLAKFTTGNFLSMYDVDTDLLYLSMKGSQVIESFDISQPDKWINVDKCSVNNQISGVCLSHKSVCDTYNSEIDRIYAAAPNRVITVPVKVPRKKAGYDPTLYPPTCGWNPILNVEEWCNGDNKSPKEVDILVLRDIDNNNQKKDNKTSLSSTNNNNNNNNIEEKKEEIKEKPKPVVYVPSATRKKIETMVKRSLFANTRLTEPGVSSKDKYYFDVKVDARRVLPGGQNLKMNSKFWACPWKTVGGSAVVVWPLNIFGRLDDNVLIVRGHKSQILDMDVCQWDDSLLVTCGEHGHAYVWKIDTSKNGDLTEPLIDLIGSGKMSHVRFHPTIKDLLVTSSMGFDGYHVRVWDLQSPNEPKLHISGQHNEPLFDINLSLNGKYLSTTSRDGYVRIFNIKNGDLMYSWQPEGGRDCRVWITQDDKVITCGFGPRSSRIVALWDMNNLDKHVSKLLIDNTNNAMIPYYDEDTQLFIMASKGSRIIRCFQVGDKHIEWLLNWNVSQDVNGMAFYHKTSCDISKVEIARACLLYSSFVMPVSISVPRKRKAYFQDDLFPPTIAQETIGTCNDLYNGQLNDLKYVDLCPNNMIPLSKAPPEEMTEKQKKYQNFKREQAKEKPKGLFGTAEDTQAHFINMAQSGANARNRWDAGGDDEDDIDDDEWSD